MCKSFFKSAAAMAAALLTCLPGFVLGNSIVSAAESKFTAADTIKIRHYILDTGVVSKEEAMSYDMDGNGKINILDLQSVKRSILCPPEVTVRPLSVNLNVEMVYQNPELPTGCEATALTNVLGYSGFRAPKTTVAGYMPRMDFYYSGGIRYGADFMTTFPGNPYYNSGYGCYTPCMVTTAERFFEAQGADNFELRDISGTDFDTLLSYAAAGKPVMAWATMSMIEPRENSDSWTTPDGRRVVWKGNEHCLVITGYDLQKGIVYVNDPLKGKVTYSISTYEHRYNQMGKYAAVIARKNEDIVLPVKE